MENSTEIWKDIPDYEALYQCSNLGRVKSLSKPKYLGSRVGNIMTKERIMVLCPDRKGYLIVCLTKNKKVKHDKYIDLL